MILNDSLKISIFNKGFNYSQDGPGNRLVYHLQGCNFKCKWCANFEGINTLCEKTKDIAVKDILKEIESCKPMFFDGGGVTFTGGEATLQFNALKNILLWCKDNFINTCVETNGSHPRLLEIVDCIDYLIMDIKHYDVSKHLYWTGDNGKNTFNNFEQLCKTGKKFLIRIPLINDVNTHPNEFIIFFKKYNCFNISFEFLPYHEYGKEKWTEKYEISNGFVNKQQLKDFRESFLENGFKVVST